MVKPLRIVPLGGLGEVGKNCLVLEYDQHLLVIDTGILFPEESVYGVDLAAPDFSYVLDRRDRVRGIVLTHGHEDHVGALPLLMREIQPPVYGAPLTLALARHKLEEAGLTGYQLYPVEPGDILHTGPFSLRFIHVCHSIPDGVGLAIETPLGTVVHTGDFKIDHTPVDAFPTQLDLFALHGQNALLLLSDSTNVDKEGYSLSEKDVGEKLEGIFFKAPGRIFVATFASHIHRVQQILLLSQRFNRKVVLAGKRLEENTRIAQGLGYLHIPQDLVISISRMGDYPDSQLTIITTGSQGEPMSVLYRMAMGEHKQLRVKEGDTVIISSRPIPGNERAIAKILNQLFMAGATVLYQEITPVHTSGHAHREELKLMINLVKPCFFMPLHGEFLHLIFHSQLAQSLGIPRERIILAQDGDIIELTPLGFSLVDHLETEDLMISGKGIGDIGPQILKERMRMSRFGTVVVLLVIDPEGTRLMERPRVIARGLSEEGEALEEELTNLVEEALSQEPHLLREDEELKEAIHRVVKRHLGKSLERRPLILPVIVRFPSS
jgi:ribonuclease J